MSESHDVVVVGGGLEGLSVAWSLTRRGVSDVLVLERSTLCSGGTAKSSGVVRCHYGVPSLAAMAWYGVSVFEQAEKLLGEDVGFQQTGYVVGVAPGDVAALHANVAMQQALGIDVGLLSAAEAQLLWPQADLTDFGAFAYEPRGGYGDAYLTGQAFARRAKVGGAQIRQHSAVTEISATAGRVDGVVVNGTEQVSAGVVVLAAGPWSVPLCAPLGIDLPVRSQHEQVLLVDSGEPVGDVPVFSDLVSLQYVRPERSGQLLVGNSDHARPRFVDPDSYRDAADEEFVESAVRKLDRRFPKLVDPRLSTSYAGCYDVTPDYNPVLGPALPGLLLCTGFSGHGFKISPAVGRLMADIICDGKSSDPAVRVDDFSLDRFAEGAPLVSPHPYTAAGQMR